MVIWGAESGDTGDASRSISAHHMVRYRKESLLAQPRKASSGRKSLSFARSSMMAMVDTWQEKRFRVARFGSSGGSRRLCGRSSKMAPRRGNGNRQWLHHVMSPPLQRVVMQGLARTRFLSAPSTRHRDFCMQQQPNGCD